MPGKVKIEYDHYMCIRRTYVLTYPPIVFSRAISLYWSSILYNASNLNWTVYRSLYCMTISLVVIIIIVCICIAPYLRNINSVQRRLLQYNVKKSV